MYEEIKKLSDAIKQLNERVISLENRTSSDSTPTHNPPHTIPDIITRLSELENKSNSINTPEPISNEKQLELEHRLSALEDKISQEKENISDNTPKINTDSQTKSEKQTLILERQHLQANAIYFTNLLPHAKCDKPHT